MLPDSSRHDSISPAHGWLISFAFWTGFAVIAVTPGHFNAIERGLVDPEVWGWWRTFAGWLPRYEVWAVLSPPIFWLAIRFPIQRARGIERGAMHAVASAAVAIFGAALHSAVICAIWPHPSYWAHAQRMMLANFSDGVATYWIVLLVAHAYVFHRLARTTSREGGADGPPRAAPPVDYLHVRLGNRTQLIPTSEIDWLEADGDYVRAHVGPKSHLVSDTLAALLARLDAKTFVRIHRARAVNVSRIRSLQRGPHGEYIVLLGEGDPLKAGRSFTAALNERFGSGAQ